MSGGGTTNNASNGTSAKVDERLKWYLQWGTLFASIALSAGLLVSKVDVAQSNISELSENLKETSKTLRDVQLEQARRSSQLEIIERRINEIDSKLGQRR